MDINIRKFIPRGSGLIIIGSLALVLALGVTDKNMAEDKSYEKLRIFTDILKTVENNYVEEVNTEQLYEGAINGMLNNLDSHSSYMKPQDYQEMQVETKGSFGGLGIEITVKSGRLTVVAPIDGTPADRAGIKSGDWIVQVDSKPTKDMTLTEAVSMMRGPKGSKVTISIMRKGFERPQDFTLERDIINIKNVTSELVDNKIGYIKIRQFQERTDEDLDKAISELKEQGAKDLILDLRNNPGGLLNMAISVADRFLEKGKMVVSTKGRIAGQNKEYRALSNNGETDFPLALLVNAGSASASEIVAGAIQDWHRGIIIGSQTFGKGSVQTVIGLSDGSGLRLTTAHYYTPKGTNIHTKGITPDIVVEEEIPGLSKLGGKGDKIHIIRESDLRQFKKNDKNGGQEYLDEELPEVPAEPESAPDKDQELPEPEAEQSPKKGKDLKADPVVRRAMDILTANRIFNYKGESAVVSTPQ